jgi:hypothetical protein
MWNSKGPSLNIPNLTEKTKNYKGIPSGRIRLIAGVATPKVTFDLLFTLRNLNYFKSLSVSLGLGVGESNPLPRQTFGLPSEQVWLPPQFNYAHMRG